MKHIVYLHGLNCSGKIFSYVESKLPKHKAYFLDYDSSVPIETALTTVLERLPSQNFSIVSHSLGGILGHLIASRDPSRSQVESLVTISTPFGGSKQASLLRWVYPGFMVLSDLAPSSAVMAEIKKTPKLHCDFLSIVSVDGHLPFIRDQNDGVVTIESQLSIEPTKRVEIHSNHFESVQDPATVAEIKKFLF
jgi:pimeloyl-ACP methyl ester carboxylesterase